MGKIDTLTKQYVQRPEVFADIFNYLLYNGQEVILPAHLTELDATELALPRGKNKARGSVQKYRDVLKNAVIKTDGRAAYSLILGVENQTNEAYRHLDPLTAGVANAVTNSNIKLEANERGEIDMCVAIDEIRKDGIEQGQELFAAMQAWLQENGRMPDVVKTISDKDFREKMLAEYQEAMQNL